MSRGRPAKPTKLKVIQGTLRPDRIKKNELSPDLLATLPDAPEYFTPQMVEIWQTKGEQLIRNGILSDLDIDMFATYCTELAMYIKCHDDILLNGSMYTNKQGTQKVRPIVSQANMHLKAVMQLSSMFGMTPATRTRVEQIKAKGSNFFETIRREKL